MGKVAFFGLSRKGSLRVTAVRAHGLAEAAGNTLGVVLRVHTGEGGHQER